MRESESKLRALLGHVFETAHESSEPGFESRKSEFVFHMLDWQEDQRRLASLYGRPGEFTVDQATEAVNGVLFHAVGHLMAAARLYGSLSDPFGDREPDRSE